VRDFKRGDMAGGHPDFETVNTGAIAGQGVPDYLPGTSYGHRVDMVSYTLGADGKPVYNPTRPSNDHMHSSASFGQWYNDVAGVNESKPLTLTLNNGQASPGGVYSYSSAAFFPIDGQMLGNQNQKDGSNAVRNFSFTFELNTKFTYKPGQNFKFTGDDDVFVFINGKKVLDLGGVHSAISGNVILFDGKAFSFNANAQLPNGGGGIVQQVGSSYATQLATKWSAAGLPSPCPLVSGTRYINLNLTNDQECTLDFFFAERHVIQSNFRIDTSMLLQAVQPTTITALRD